MGPVSGWRTTIEIPLLRASALKPPVSCAIRGSTTNLSIHYWQQRYERNLESIGPEPDAETLRSGAERFLGKYPGKTYGHQFLRPVINDYVQSRLAEGASVSTARLEMSAIRGLFQFALDMRASDVMFNPAKNVKVKKPKRASPEAAPNEMTESPLSSPIEMP